MTKDDSQIIKGVAILMMIFLHLIVADCTNLIYIGVEPLSSILKQATNPVAFFLIVGGYGLYKVWQRGDKHRWSRLAKLLTHYWIITLIFVAIGWFIFPDKYPGSAKALLSTFSLYESAYNGEMWFLLPYMVLSAIAPWLFKLFARFRPLTVIGVTLFIHLCTSFCISRYGQSFWFYNYWAYNPLLVFHLLFNFALGATAARCNFFESLSQRFSHLSSCKIFLATVVGVICLVSISCVFKYNFFYAFLLICCIVLMPKNRFCSKFLCTMGNHSMNMWMVHTWFCTYLFHDFFYSLKYPLLIMAMVAIVSYLSSLIINTMCKPITSFITLKLSNHG